MKSHFKYSHVEFQRKSKGELEKSPIFEQFYFVILQRGGNLEKSLTLCPTGPTVTWLGDFN